MLLELSLGLPAHEKETSQVCTQLFARRIISAIIREHLNELTITDYSILKT